MSDIAFTVPLPPSVNHCYRNRTRRYFKGGVWKQRRERVLTKVAQAWVSHAWAVATDARVKAALSKRPKGEKVILELRYFWPDRRRRDTHNLHKLICDAFEGAIYEDDQWALPRDMDFEVDRARPRLEVVVKGGRILT